MKQITKIFVLFTIMGIGALSASAQSHINALVQQLEKSSSANITYVEKRDPQTKKIASSKIVINVPDSEVKNVINALNADRSNSVSFEKSGNRLYRLTFENEKSKEKILFVMGDTDLALMNGVPFQSITNNGANNVLMLTTTME